MPEGPFVHPGESPFTPPLPFPLLPHLAPPLPKGATRVYVGAVHGALPAIDLPLSAISPGAFRLTGVRPGAMDEVPWAVSDTLFLFLAALGLSEDALPRTPLSSIVHALPAGAATLVGVGAPAEAALRALERDRRRLVEPGRQGASIIISGRRPGRQALAAALEAAPQGSVLLHTGLLEDLPPTALTDAARRGTAIVAVTWGREPDLVGYAGERRTALIPDSPSRVRNLLWRLFRQTRGRRGRAGSV